MCCLKLASEVSLSWTMRTIAIVAYRTLLLWVKDEICILASAADGSLNVCIECTASKNAFSPALSLHNFQLH